MSALYKVTHVCIKYCMKCKLRCIKSYAIFLVLHCYTPFVLLRTGFFMTNAFYIDLKNAVSKYIFIPESFVSCHVTFSAFPYPFRLRKSLLPVIGDSDTALPALTGSGQEAEDDTDSR